MTSTCTESVDGHPMHDTAALASAANLLNWLSRILHAHDSAGSMEELYHGADIIEDLPGHCRSLPVQAHISHSSSRNDNT